MTIAQMHDYFELLLDKYNQPNFTSDEIDTLLQQAEIKVVNDYYLNRNPKTGESYNQAAGIVSSSESRSTDLESIKTLVKQVRITAINGDVTYARLNAMAGGQYMQLMNVVVDGVYAKFVRHNDEYRFAENSFKKATTTRPHVLYFSDKVKILPESNNIVEFTMLMFPTPVSLTNNISSDLPSGVHNEVVAVALDLAGVANRDEALQYLAQAGS